jgi:CRP/FNR family transcriptional regulator
MSVSCQGCPLRKRSLFVPMSDSEVAFMQDLKLREQHVVPGATIINEGETSPHLYTVLSGMGTRFKMLEDGRLQVVNFLMPGDFIGLQAGFMGKSRHTARAVTDMILCVFPRERLWEIFRSEPERAYDLTWIAAVEEHFLGDTIATLGQRTAEERLAWALLRFWQRLDAIGLSQGDRVPLPYRQQDIADALGLSLVHTNKTAARLRQAGVAIWHNRSLQVPDVRALMAVAGVDPERIERRPLM